VLKQSGEGKLDPPRNLFTHTPESKRIGELVNSSNPGHGSFNSFNKPDIDLFVHHYSFLTYADKR